MFQHRFCDKNRCRFRFQWWIDSNHQTPFRIQEIDSCNVSAIVGDGVLLLAYDSDTGEADEVIVEVYAVCDDVLQVTIRIDTNENNTRELGWRNTCR